MDAATTMAMMGAMDASPATLVAMAIGLFYAIGGLLLLRRLPGEAVMDQMIAALGDATAPAERQRTRVWMLGGAMTFASGVSLVALSRWAPALFVATSLFQLGYLVWVRSALPAENEEERAGRRAVIQALVIYLVATGFVLWLDRQGAWRAWLDPAWLELLALVAITAAVSAVLLRGAFWTAQPLPFDMPATTGPKAVRLSPEYRMSPLRERTENVPVDAADLGLDAELVARIAAWDARFQALFDDEDPFAFDFPDLATEQAWFEEGLDIAADIQMGRDGLLVNDLSGLDTMMRYARRALDPTTPTPIEEAAAMAPRCGVAEIREVIAALDRLAWEKAQVEDWDGDTQDDIARGQLFHAHILAHVRDKYLPEVRRGLDSEEEETRRWVALALDMRRKDGEGHRPSPDLTPPKA